MVIKSTHNNKVCYRTATYLTVGQIKTILHRFSKFRIQHESDLLSKNLRIEYYHIILIWQKKSLGSPTLLLIRNPLFLFGLESQFFLFNFQILAWIKILYEIYLTYPLVISAVTEFMSLASNLIICISLIFAYPLH